jgi:hypothetical protein
MHRVEQELKGLATPLGAGYSYPSRHLLAGKSATARSDRLSAGSGLWWTSLVVRLRSRWSGMRCGSCERRRGGYTTELNQLEEPSLLSLAVVARVSASEGRQWLRRRSPVPASSARPAQHTPPPPAACHPPTARGRPRRSCPRASRLARLMGASPGGGEGAGGPPSYRGCRRRYSPTASGAIARRVHPSAGRGWRSLDPARPGGTMEEV